MTITKSKLRKYPTLIRKIEKVAASKKLSFSDACVFFAEKAVSPLSCFMFLFCPKEPPAGPANGKRQ